MSRRAEFLTGLLFEDISTGDEILRIKLTSPFGFFSDVLLAEVWIPTGFVCDGESIPPLLHSLVPPFGVSRRGAVAHDYLYRHGGYQDADGGFRQVSRKVADQVYLELLKLAGLSSWRAYNRYFQLRLYGWFQWNRHRKNDSN